LRDPKGSQFEVKVVEFPLELPDYIFWTLSGTRFVTLSR